MALSVAPTNYQLIHECLATTGWTGNSTSLVTDFSKRGAACVGFILRTSGNNDVYVTGSWDLTGKTLRTWYMTAALKEIDIEANNGIQFFLYDGTNTGYWTVGGSDTYPGGWINYCLDLSRTPDSGTQPNLAAITRVGMRIVMTSAPKNAQNTWVDFVHCSDSLDCSDATPFTLADVYAVENATTGAWGILRRFGGVYYSVGGLKLSGLSDSSQALVFENRPVGASLYTIEAAGDFQVGTKVGSAGVSGLSVRTQNLAQTPKWFLTCTAATSDDFYIYGSALLDSGALTLPAASATREILNTSFEECAKISVGNCKIRQSNFISAKTEAILLPSGDAHDITDSAFINNPKSVQIDTAGTYNFTNLTFTGNTYDVDNTSGGSVTVSAGGTSNPTTYTGSTTIQNTKSKTFTGLPSNTEIRIRQGSHTLAHEQNVTVGYYIYSYTASDRPAKAQFTLPGYVFEDIEFTLDATDGEFPVTFAPDPSYV